MNVEQLKNLLRTNHIAPNFTYGQNFLIDDIVLQDIVDTAELTSADSVLEIGPGLGALTKRLCQQAHLVLSIDKDPKFLPILKSIKKDHENLRFEIADALEYDFQKFFKNNNCLSYKVVANIPYYITGKILQMLLAAEFKPESITLLTQKEVASNVGAKAGDLSILAISVQIFGQPQVIRTVPAESFYPVPKVDSAILKIVPNKKTKYVIADEKKFFRVVKACFAGKRKQIHNTLINNLRVPKEGVEKLLEELQIPFTARPQELSIENWIALAEKIQN